ARPDRRRPGAHVTYRAVCVVREDSAIRTVDDLQREANNEHLQYLFVHPFSLSGRIAPELALLRAGMVVDRTQTRYTYGELESLRQLKLDAGRRVRVAFVSDEALSDAPETVAGLRNVDFPQLDSLDLPQQVVVAKRGFRFSDSLRALLETHEDAVTGRTFQHLPNWKALYDQAGQWCRELQLTSLAEDAQNITLDELGEMLLQFAHSRAQLPRIALVLSGGGAKCAYQMGVVAALEEKLAELRQANPQAPLDISLVAGTSGGAINALPIALGITSTADGRADAATVWKSLDQRQIVCPTWIVRLNIGLWFAVVQITLVLALSRLLVRNAAWLGWVDGTALLALAALNAGVAAVPHVPWRWLGTNHLWHHLWTWIGFGLWWSGGVLFLGSVILLLMQHKLRSRGLTWRGVRPRTAFLWGLLLLGLPMLQLPTVLLGARTLSGGEGIERALSSDIPRLLNAHLQRQNKPGLPVEGLAAKDSQLRNVSRQIMRRRLLTRDLVVTGSSLAQSEMSLPNDLYFYASARAEDAPPSFGERGVNLARHPDLLLDAVLGSGTVFPIFPPRTLHDFPRPGQQVELIDGGFSHNSPIEAAVLWGATHIILIESSPRARIAMQNLAENAAAAFSLLHRQTQSVDLRSKRQVVVFTMTPEPPHVCILDFAENLVEAAMQRGYRDARGYRDQDDPTLPAQPTFRKELGEPVFTPVAIEPPPG
ncbi:MAG: patatin-like phospholipase family protein, partial [Pirellulaceae bacterium]|nr:patatin-like phospholipase family protein [Pirellulaceae bacterium]